MIMEINWLRLQVGRGRSITASVRTMTAGASFCENVAGFGPSVRSDGDLRRLINDPDDLGVRFREGPANLNYESRGKKDAQPSARTSAFRNPPALVGTNPH